MYTFVYVYVSLPAVIYRHVDTEKAEDLMASAKKLKIHLSFLSSRRINISRVNCELMMVHSYCCCTSIIPVCTIVNMIFAPGCACI